VSDELRRAFGAEARRRLSTIEKGAGDPAREAHTLRGSAAVVGVHEVELLAAKLEEALAAEETAEARALTARIRALLDGPVEAGTAPAVGVPAAPTGDRVVLYVEDSRPNAVLVERTLATRGFRMLNARTGAEGLRLAREARPGLVLLDLRLPDMDGAEVVRRLREQPETAAVPVVVVSGGIGPEAAEALAAAGVHAFLGKPFPLERLLALVEDAFSA
jgi:CheY-like chemotaxis protein